MKTNRTDFEIDDLRLPWEWNRQASLVYRYGEHLADCQRALDEARGRLELAKAEADAEIRRDPGKYGLEKITEKAVEAIVPTTEGYQAANRAVLDTRHDLDLARAACSALDHKKRALEKLVDLHLSGWYAEPRDPAGDNSREDLDDARKREIRGRARRKLTRGESE